MTLEAPLLCVAVCLIGMFIETGFDYAEFGYGVRVW